MKKVFSLIYALSAALLSLSSCQAQTTSHKGPSLEIVKQTILKVYYNYINKDTTDIKTTIEFHSIKFGEPGTAGKLKYWYIPDTTLLFPVLAKYTVTSEIAYLHPPTYDIHDITKAYVFYKDGWGNWTVTEASGSRENQDIERHK